jgi:signal peptidase I
MTFLASISVLAVLVFLAVRILRRHLMIISVNGDSMEPTYSDGDLLLVRKNTRPHRNDVVVFVHPEAGTKWVGKPNRILLIKRLVALPGDVFPPSDRARETLDTNFPKDGHRVPEHHVYVLGDNPETSADSRLFGPVHVHLLVGGVIRRMPGSPGNGGRPSSHVLHGRPGEQAPHAEHDSREFRRAAPGGFDAIS